MAKENKQTWAAGSLMFKAGSKGSSITKGKGSRTKCGTPGFRWKTHIKACPGCKKELFHQQGQWPFAFWAINQVICGGSKALGSEWLGIMYDQLINYMIMPLSKSEMLRVCSQEQLSLICIVRRSFPVIATPMALVDRPSSGVGANLF